jgi:hypothetical protein
VSRASRTDFHVLVLKITSSFQRGRGSRTSVLLCKNCCHKRSARRTESP